MHPTNTPRTQARIYDLLSRLFTCAIILAAALAIGLAPRTALAEVVERSVEVDGITYTLDIDTEAMTAEITGMTDPASPSQVEVPGTVEVDGAMYTVTSMMFYFTSASLPNINAVTLPDTLTSIDGRLGCFSSVSELTIPGSVRVFNASLQNMDSLRTLTFSEGVEEIGQGAGSMVSGCDKLTTINLPSTLEAINANSCFSNATALTTISLPDGLQFGSNTLSHFSDCSSLTSVTAA